MTEEEGITSNKRDEYRLNGGPFGHLFDANGRKERKARYFCPLRGNDRDTAHKICKFNANPSK